METPNKELFELCKKVAEILKRDHNPHTYVIIEDTHIRLCHEQQVEFTDYGMDCMSDCCESCEEDI